MLSLSGASAHTARLAQPAFKCKRRGRAYRHGLVLALPDLGLLQEEETVDEHAGHRDEAQAKGDTPDSVQGVVVVLVASLVEDGQQGAQHRCVDQVSPSLQHSPSVRKHSTPSFQAISSQVLTEPPTSPFSQRQHREDQNTGNVKPGC